MEEVIKDAEATTADARDGHLDELEKKLIAEQEKVQGLIETVTTSETLIREIGRAHV